jgi:hypothetical protein
LCRISTQGCLVHVHADGNETYNRRDKRPKVDPDDFEERGVFIIHVFLDDGIVSAGLSYNMKGFP